MVQPMVQARRPNLHASPSQNEYRKRAMTIANFELRSEPMSDFRPRQASCAEPACPVAPAAFRFQMVHAPPHPGPLPQLRWRRGRNVRRLLENSCIGICRTVICKFSLQPSAFSLTLVPVGNPPVYPGPAPDRGHPRNSGCCGRKFASENPSKFRLGTFSVL